MNTEQTAFELIVKQLDWACQNINNNLDFVPDDKLDWKPAPTANSVLEIINHATGTVHSITSAMQGAAKTELQPATNRAQAKQLMTQVVQAHQAKVRALTPAELGQSVKLPFGEFPMAFVAGLPVVEMINHHGQITYIQTLLGDPESHMIMQ